MNQHLCKLAATVLTLILVVHATDALSDSHNSATTAENKPRIENFQFTPEKFREGKPVVLSFDYYNVRGGLAGSVISLDYQGFYSRKSSSFSEIISGGKEESGTFSKKIHIRPSDPPPIPITYYLTITDAADRESNSVSTEVVYE